MANTSPDKKSMRCARAPLAIAILALSPSVFAQAQLEEVIVTAQKRTENLQDVPISIQSLGNESLSQLNIQKFTDYVKMLPSVAATPYLGGVGFAQVYFRGIATGGDGQAITSQPSVGMYLDEMPITTIQGNLDVNIYDVARVEALAGPQGTLYGASSQAGTIRIISNKPDPSAFDAGYDLELNTVKDGEEGYTGQGFVNIPINEKAAVRLVGWHRKDAGYIDNVRRTRTFGGDQSTPDDDVVASNDAFAEDDYNDVSTTGARAALRVDLSEDWTATATVMGQRQKSNGSFGEDLSRELDGFDETRGDREVSHIQDEFVKDKWYMASLTVEGKAGMFDVTYSGAYLNRKVDGSFDYSDYSYFYDAYYSTGYFFRMHVDNNGNQLFPGARFTNDDEYDRWTHEIRISTPQDRPVRAMVGYFRNDAKHDFLQHWLVAGLADNRTPNGRDPGATQFYPDTVYMNNMEREDIDRAWFGQVAFDITDSLELTLGMRRFRAGVDVDGFFGFGLGLNRPWEPGTEPGEEREPGSVANGGEGAYAADAYWWGTNGEWRCPSQADYKDTPCQNVDSRIREKDEVYRVNLSWKISDDHMVYATWSEGYRPGGVNRNPFEGNFDSDYLTNYELGWKTQWLDNSLQFNGAVFLETWDKYQVGFQGSNGITQVANGKSATVKGTEMQLLWAASEHLTISASGAYYDTEIEGAYCGRVVNFQPVTKCFKDPKARDGDELPLTAHFKGNLMARYTFPLGGYEAHLQGTLAYQGKRGTYLDRAENAVTGDLPSNTFIDVAAGVENDTYAIEFFVQNLTDEDAPLYQTSECSVTVCSQTYGVIARPRTMGLRFAQRF